MHHPNARDDFFDVPDFTAETESLPGDKTPPEPPRFVAEPHRSAGRTAGASRPFRCRQRGLALNDHSGTIRALALFPGDPFHAVSAGDDGALTWNLGGASPVARQIANDPLTACRVLATGQGPRVVLGHADGRVTLHTPEGVVESTFEDHRAPVRALLDLPGGLLVSADALGRVIVHQLATSTVVATGGPSWGGTYALARAADASAILHAGDDGSVYQMASGTAVARQVFGAHALPVRALSTLPGGHIVTASADHTISVWQMREAALVVTLDQPTDTVTALATAVDGDVALAVSLDGSILAFEPRRGAVLVHLILGEPLLAVALSPDGRFALTGGEMLRMWDLERG